MWDHQPALVTGHTGHVCGRIDEGSLRRSMLIELTSTGLWKFVGDAPVAYIAETLRQDFSLYIYIAETLRPEPSLS